MIFALLSVALLPVALAVQPSLEGHVHASSGLSGRAGPNNGGLGLSAGAWFSPRFAAEVLAQGGPAGFAIRPELRFVLTDPEASWGRMEAVAGYGVDLDLDRQLIPLGAIGLGLYLPTDMARWGLRIQGRYLVAGTAPESLQLSLGLIRKAAPQEQAPVEPIPSEPAPEQGIIVDAPIGPEWVPYPVCAWLSEEEATQARADLADELQGGPTPGSADVVVLDPSAPTQGSVIVVSRAGDQVQVQGESLTIGPTGLLVLAAPPGRLDLSITGAGQSSDFVVGVAPDQVVWVRGDTMPAPEPLRIHYPGGSRQITEAERALLEDFIVLLGDWDVQVQGLYSPEGSMTSNLELAESRAQAAKKILVSGGISEDRIEILPPPEQASETLSTTDQRAALVIPVIPGGEQ
ncbi:MAG: hypothetical protein ACI9VR_000194 [Cognaticolwellia sp.]|jgi:hypothetical protein